VYDIIERRDIMLYTGPWNAQDDWELGQAWKRWSDAWDERQAEIQAERNAWRRAQRLEQELDDLKRVYKARMMAYATLKERTEAAEKRIDITEKRLGEMIALMIDYANEALDQTASKNVLRRLISKLPMTRRWRPSATTFVVTPSVPCSRPSVRRSFRRTGCISQPSLMHVHLIKPM
jgi:hypothetical protein